VGNILSEVLVKNKTYEPLHPENITIKGKTVTIDYVVPAPPLVLDTWTNVKTTNFGFAVYKNNATVAIQNVEITQDNQLTITCNADLIGNIEVVYAGNTTAGTGNVSDSYTKTSRYTYFDDSADTKKENYTPQDKSGNKIYGQPYPMQNWSVGFYHQANVTATGLNQPVQPAIQVYPNPVTDRLNISGKAKEAVVSVYDYAGKRLLSTGNDQIDFSSFSNGFYLVGVEGSIFKINKTK
jgi:hypothetical protein